MTRDEFFPWAEAQDGRYEFDGYQPVAMGNVTINHGLITNNIHRALFDRLQGTGCQALGPEVGMATIGDIVRNSDAMVTCSKLTGTDYLVPGVIVVFEVLSASSSRLDRITKVREYAAVSSIRQYIIVESTGMGLTVLWRDSGDQPFTTHVLTGEEHLQLAELKLVIPVEAFYVGVEYPDAS
jgi:Uma2 family endonuclease